MPGATAGGSWYRERMDPFHDPAVCAELIRRTILLSSRWKMPRCRPLSPGTGSGGMPAHAVTRPARGEANDCPHLISSSPGLPTRRQRAGRGDADHRSEEHTSELQSHSDL